jgi:hypothetical protein
MDFNFVRYQMEAVIITVRCKHQHQEQATVTHTECFKKSFTTLKAYRNLYRGHTQRFELSKCSKTHRGFYKLSKL